MILDRAIQRIRNGLRIDGRTETINGVTVEVLTRDGNGDIFICSGITVPTADSAGFSKPGFFFKTDAGDGVKGLYENQGTALLSDFNVIGSITSAELGSNLTLKGNTIVGETGSDTVSFAAKLTGQLYCNDTGKSVQTLKIHNHLNSSEIGGGEFKGEFINKTGTVDGVAFHWEYTPTDATGAPDAVRSAIGNMTLTAANTMTAGMIAGGQYSTIISGILNGAAILEFGVVGVLAGTGTRTLVAHSAGVASLLHVLAGDEPATGELSLFYGANDFGGTCDNAIYLKGGACTNFLKLEATTFLSDSTGAFDFDDQAGSLKVETPAGTRYLCLFAAHS